MEKKKFIKLAIVLIQIVFFAGYVWLRVENVQQIHEPRTSFGDTHEFLDIAAETFLSQDFWISLRPAGVPLVYKILGGDIQNIVTFQFAFSVFAWLILALAVTSVIQSYWVKALGFALILAFSLSKEFIMWEYIVLGNSISISFMILFFASGLWLLAKWTPVRLSVFLIASLLFTFTRDDFSYFVLMLGGGLLILLFCTTHWRKVLFVSCTLFLMFFVSNSLSSQSLRWYRPLLNTIGLRILPNPDYVAYFENKGMPITPALMERSGKHLHADENAIVVDPRLEAFRTWVQENGKNEFIRFLWFYKADTFQNLFGDIGIVFSPDLYYYTATGFRPIIKDSRLEEFLYPNRFGFFLFLVANFFAVALSVVGLYEKKLLWFLPISLILLTYPQAILVWNADANDLARHSMYHNMILRTGFWVLVLFFIDFLIEKKSEIFSYFSLKLNFDVSN